MILIKPKVYCGVRVRVCVWCVCGGGGGGGGGDREAISCMYFIVNKKGFILSYLWLVPI